MVSGIEVFVTGPDTLEVAVTNRGLRSFRGDAVLVLGGRLRKPQCPKSRRGETRRIAFRSPVRFSSSPVKGTLTLTLNGQKFEESLSLKSFFVPHLEKITIDGSLDEWKKTFPEHISAVRPTG